MASDDDSTLRTEYDRLVQRLLSGLKPEIGGEQPPRSADMADLVAYFRTRLAFRPRCLTELSALIEAMADDPGTQAQALTWLARDAEREKGEHLLACRSWALAAERFYDLGDDDAFGHAARALLARAESPRWRVHAERLLQSAPHAKPDDVKELDQLSWPGPALANDIAGLAERVTFERGDLICKAGVTADALYILRTGRVAISQRTGATLKIFRYRGPGDVIGEMGLFAPRRARTATVSASTRVEAWRVDYEALESAPNAAELTAVLAERYAIRRAEARIAQHPLFASLDLAARSELLSAIRSAPGWVPAGTSLAAHRSVCGGVFFLLDGAADVVLAGPDSREFARVRRETTDRTSELLGLDVLAGVRLWPYGLVTTSRSCVVTIPIEAMQRVLDENLMNQFPSFILGRSLTADAA